MEKTLVLKTARLTLHSFCDTDLEDVLALLYSGEIKETYMLPDFASREDAVKMFHVLKDRSTAEDRFVYGIYLNERCIGFLNDVETDGDTIEVGYVIHPSMKNQGYGTEALSAAIQELFRIGYSVVKAGFFEGNHASERVMQKSGMKKIEYTEEIEYRGRAYHCTFYSISKGDFLTNTSILL